MDNFEHLLPAATLVSELIDEAPHLKVLVTSREALHLSIEHTLEVPPLRLAPSSQLRSPTPDTATAGPGDIAEIEQSDAVRLFVERARTVEPDFSLTTTNALTIADICRRLDGLPLAIELAAARVKHVGLQHLSRLLERRLSLLVGGAADLSPRQQTLRGAIAWSYDLLTPAEQAVFRRVSVFAGGCTLEAAEAVCLYSRESSDDRAVAATIDVLVRMASLIDKSLLRFESDAHVQPRYMMLETVREFGLEQLAAANEEAETRERHATYVEELVRQATPHFLAAEQLEWLARIDDELDNVRACLARLLESAQFERGQRLTGTLWYFWSTHCRVTEGRQWLSRFLDHPRGQSTAAVARAWAYLALTFICMRQDDVVANYEASAKALALAQGGDDLWLLGMTLARLAHVTERMETRTIEPPRASPDPPAFTAVDVVDLYDEALVIFRSLHDEWAIAAVSRVLRSVPQLQRCRACTRYDSRSHRDCAADRRTQPDVHGPGHAGQSHSGRARHSNCAPIGGREPGHG